MQYQLRLTEKAFYQFIRLNFDPKHPEKFTVKITAPVTGLCPEPLYSSIYEVETFGYWFDVVSFLKSLSEPLPLIKELDLAEIYRLRDLYASGPDEIKSVDRFLIQKGWLRFYDVEKMNCVEPCVNSREFYNESGSLHDRYSCIIKKHYLDTNTK